MNLIPNTIAYTTFMEGLEDSSKFTKRGELPKGTRRVQIQIPSASQNRPFGNYSLAEATKIIEDAYASGHTRHDAYYIVPLETAPMPEEVKEIFRKKAAVKNDKPLIACANEDCKNEFPRSRGRYPKKICPNCEKRED